jgi:hypothetical protein
MLGKKGAPSLFKFGFKVVLEGACIRAWPNWVLCRRVGDWWC